MHANAAPDLSGSRLDVMNFLNEIANRFPDAISFASGRPAEQFFLLEEWLGGIATFARHFADKQGVSLPVANALIAQYGRTNGFISDLIAEQVRNDEGIECDAARIIVTAGCQEGIALAVQALCTDPGDVLLACNPTYIGITGVADINGIELVPVNAAGPAQFGVALKSAIDGLLAGGKRPKALYVIPEFDNPTGSVMPLDVRRELLRTCAANGIVVLEDNPYGMFRFEGEPLPALASLDEAGCVIYLGTYSKSLCPAVRTGFMILPRTLGGSIGARDALLEKISVIKSFVTVNTSQITQAIVGGVLLREHGSLRAVIEPAREHYARNRDVMLAALDETFGDVPGISWNRPAGGFFLTLTLPFEFAAAEATICARDFGVIVMPLSFFALDGGYTHEIRLAFSNQPPDAIRAGVRRLAEFFASRLSERRRA